MVEQEQKKWVHSDLIADLSVKTGDHLSMSFTEIAAGSRWFQEAKIPDLLVMQKSYTKTNIRIYEIKVSQADFRQDVQAQKWTSYLPLCDQFYFAIPNYLKWQELLGPHTQAGVIVRGPKGWKVVRRSNKDKREEQDEIFWQSLLFQVYSKEQRRRWDQTELEKSQAYLDQLKEVNEKLRSYHGLVDKKLDAKLKDIMAREDRLQYSESNAEARFVKKLKAKLEVTGWHEGMKGMLKELVMGEMQKAGEAGVAKLVNYIMSNERVTTGKE